MNKRQLAIFNNYKNSYKRELFDCYKSYSHNKMRAYGNCINQMMKRDGYDFRIISHNSHIFTVGFKFKDETGSEKLMYISPTKMESFYIEEDN